MVSTRLPLVPTKFQLSSTSVVILALTSRKTSSSTSLLVLLLNFLVTSSSLESVVLEALERTRKAKTSCANNQPILMSPLLPPFLLLPLIQLRILGSLQWHSVLSQIPLLCLGPLVLISLSIKPFCLLNGWKSCQLFRLLRCLSSAFQSLMMKLGLAPTTTMMMSTILISISTCLNQLPGMHQGRWKLT